MGRVSKTGGLKSRGQVAPHLFPDPNTVIPVMEGINNIDAMAPVQATTRHALHVQLGFAHPVYTESDSKTANGAKTGQAKTDPPGSAGAADDDSALLADASAAKPDAKTNSHPKNASVANFRRRDSSGMAESSTMKEAEGLTPELFPDPHTVIPVLEGVNDIDAMAPVASTTRHMLHPQMGFVQPVYSHLEPVQAAFGAPLPHPPLGPPAGSSPAAAVAVIQLPQH